MFHHAVVIRVKVKEVQNNVAIYSHALRQQSYFALMTTGAFSQNVGKVILRTQVGNR